MSPPDGGLGALAGKYRVLLCDIWGVVHNGVGAFPAAVDALQRFRRQGGAVALITNAPRPASSVQAQLAELAVVDAAYDLVVTSGDVIREMVATNRLERLFHLGPERDLPLFHGLETERVAPEHAQAIMCTGLYDDETEAPDDYRAMLGDLAHRELPLYCANPDRLVRRGEDLFYCAGALADLYQQLGGEVIMAGKPHSPIYERALNELAALTGRRPDKSEILVIGDGIDTDIQGAASNGMDAMFVTGGIHADEVHGGQGTTGGLNDRLEDIAGLNLAATAPELAW